MSQTAILKPVANVKNPDLECDIIFIHGLAGDHESTWKNPDTLFDWPHQFGLDNPKIAIWSFGYPATMTNWYGDGMTIPDRSRNFHSVLFNTSNLSIERPKIVIVHSMGGLVLKSLIQFCKLQSDDVTVHLISIALAR